MNLYKKKIYNFFCSKFYFQGKLKIRVYFVKLIKLVELTSLVLLYLLYLVIIIFLLNFSF